MVRSLVDSEMGIRGRYLVKEETQLAACIIAFTAIVYKQFGGAIHDIPAADGERILEEHNKLEDAIIHDLQDKLYDVKMQEHVVQDANDIMSVSYTLLKLPTNIDL